MSLLKVRGRFQQQSGRYDLSNEDIDSFIRSGQVFLDENADISFMETRVFRKTVGRQFIIIPSYIELSPPFWISDDVNRTEMTINNQNEFNSKRGPISAVGRPVDIFIERRRTEFHRNYQETSNFRTPRQPSALRVNPNSIRLKASQPLEDSPNTPVLLETGINYIRLKVERAPLLSRPKRNIIIDRFGGVDTYAQVDDSNFAVAFLYPTPVLPYTIEIPMILKERQLVEGVVDENEWSRSYPEILVFAALRELNASYGNNQRTQHFTRIIHETIEGININYYANIGDTYLFPISLGGGEL